MVEQSVADCSAAGRVSIASIASSRLCDVAVSVGKYGEALKVCA
jgi:hypothetical protein